MNSKSMILCFLLVAILIIGRAYAVTSSTSSSTSSTISPTTTYSIYTTTIIPGLNVSAGTIFTSGFNNVAYFAYLIMLLGFGIAYIRSHKLSFGMFAAMVIGLLEMAIGFALSTASGNLILIINPVIVALMGFGFALAFWYEYATGK